jgi:hypothetical protein
MPETMPQAKVQADRKDWRYQHTERDKPEDLNPAILNSATLERQANPGILNRYPA